MATSLSAVSSINTQAADTQILQAAAKTSAAVSAAPPASNPASNEDTVTLSSTAQLTTEQISTQVQLLNDEGQTPQQIAAALGISTQTVQADLPQPVISAPTTKTTA
ncbi:MAG TPA: helix-turn-helix domain-containing protein [Candidatus Acidoferrales bacterium]|jgi:DNA-binding NarL/FixJ family response regulator|nr:helix-turn-helix domain-containing protein [Candidatus Acidoferrales bacterium]